MRVLLFSFVLLAFAYAESFAFIPSHYRVDTYDGQEVSDETGVYCGYDYVFDDVNHAHLFCEGNGTLRCEVGIQGFKDVVVNILTNKATLDVNHGILNGSYNINLIDNGITYYGFISWNTNTSTGQSIYQITVNN